MKKQILSLYILTLAISLQGKDNYAEYSFIENLVKFTKSSAGIQKELDLLVGESRTTSNKKVFQECDELPLLFHAFPELIDSLSYISLGNFPTPIVYAPGCSYLENIGHLYIKQDGLSGGIDTQGKRLFGGNKVRKLEYLFAHANELGADSVMTFGCAGSNHATATAVYAKKLGLPSICMLKRQPNAHVVHRNLALMKQYDADIRYYPTVGLRNVGAVSAAVDYKQRYGTIPYVIPTGGSCPRGVIGFVNAAFELKKQIEQGILPEPDYIYVAAGSLGTAAGLVLGCKAAGLNSKIIAVAVEPDTVEYFEGGIKRLVKETNQLLHELAPSFPLYEFQDDEVVVRYETAGADYALFTQEGVRWMEILAHQEKIVLDGTYTGKAFAGMMRDMVRPEMKGKNVLFWNTFDSNAFEDVIADVDYHDLPKGVHRFFEEDVQPLDNAEKIRALLKREALEIVIR